MPKAKISAVTLLATVIAVGVMLVFAASGNRGYGYETTIAGFALLIVLFAYDEEGYRSVLQGVAFAAVAGFCAMLGLIYPEMALMQPKSPEQWSAFTWLGTTLLFFAVDRMSASSRESNTMGLSAPASMMPASYAPSATPAAQPARPAYTPAYPAMAAAALPAAVPTPVAVPIPPPAYQPPPPPDLPIPVIYPPSAFVAPEPEPEPAHAPAPLVIAPIAPGREAMIFLNLLGEGLNVLRSVKAEHLGRDYYRIADVMPENERWEYEPNQVVRCRKKALSNGKHLVAFEEAPRA